jgi:predicted ferric reductase
MIKRIKQLTFGWILVLVLSLVPIVLWFFADSSVSRFSDFTTSLLNFGQITGLVGTAMFAINLILSARLRVIENIFNGLNRVYSRHDQLGQIAFILLLLHPLLLLPKYSSNSFYFAAKFLLPGNNWPQNWGIFSLIGMILLLTATLFIPLKYSFWKKTHKFMGLTFFLASLHVWLIPSDVSRYLPLRLYMLGLSFAGLAAYSYYSLLGKFFVKKYSYIVKAVNFIGASVINIIMQPMKTVMRFTPGQFVFVSFKHAKIGEESHPFSIVSSPNEGNLSIAVKKLGDYTNQLDALTIGTKVEIEGPFGVFSHTATKSKRQIWIAGGIGITPFISMLKTLRPDDSFDIDLYYCVKNENEAIYMDEIKKISLYLKNSIKFFPFYSNIYGYINSDIIEKQSGGLDGKSIFICAPPSMIYDLKSQFAAKNVDKKQIYSEEFNFRT